MNNEDKVLLQKAKKVLGLKSNGEIAEAIGNKKENAINWSNRGIPEVARIKISQLINNKENECNFETIKELKKYFEMLNEEEQEMYIAEIKARALRKTIK